MYISLYRKYRPQTFSDMVGQSAAVSVLQRSLGDGRLGHAYLFSGPRGCGKTSAARLVAKTLNCLNKTDGCEPCGTCENCTAIAMGEHLDVIEIDGASNRGIGEIRDLKSHVNLKPLSSSYKVYIIDEIHMLTEPAFNALLKTLEEPPANVVFLLATTEPHKVPVTIRSRCQHIPFHRISIDDMVSRIAFVAAEENIAFEEQAVWEIARQADGALRDALSLMEQAIALGNGSLTFESVNDLMGGSSRSETEKFVSFVRTQPELAASALSKMLVRGVSLERLTESLFALFRDLWVTAAWGEKGAGALDASETELTFLHEESKNWTKDQLKAACSFLAKLLPRTRYGMRQEVFSGLVMIELTNILEGKPAQSSAATVAHTQPPVNQKKQESSFFQRTQVHVPFDALPPDNGFNDPVPSKKAQANPIGQNAQKEAPKIELDFTQALGDGVFAKLLTSIGPKALPLGAALLHADLYSDEDKGWDLQFEKSHSFAESFFNVPQNKRLLADALNEALGIKIPETQGEVEVTPQLPAQKIPGGGTEDDTKHENGEMGTILKLMGAEVLYVQDKQSSDEDSEEHEA